MSSTRVDPSVPTLEQVTNGNEGKDTIRDPDGIVVPGENDFASSTNKRNLNSYISKLTRGVVPSEGIIEYNGPSPDHRNAYALGDNAGVPDEKFISDRVGIETGYVPEGDFDSYSNSGLFDGVNDKDLANIIKKGSLGRANGQETLSGHFLLRGLDAYSSKAVGREVYDEAIPEILANKNVSNPDLPAFDRTAEKGPVTSATLSGRIKIPKIEGSLSTAAQPGAGRVSVEKLSQVAIDILLKASGKTSQSNPGFTPAMVQEGFSRVDTETLRARSASGIDGLNADVDGQAVDLPSTDGIGEDRYAIKSYGTTYNPLESFSSVTSSVTSYTIISASAFGLALAVGGLLAAATKPSSKPSYRNLKARKPDHLERGRFKFENKVTGFLAFLESAAESIGVSTDLTQILNIYTPTNGLADYGQCVILGFASLVGVTYGADDVITEPLLGGTENKVFNSPGLIKLLALVAARLVAIPLTADKGYYMNLFREIIKESGDLVRSIGDDPTSLLSPAGIGSLADAKIVRFIDTLAKIGDMIVLQVRAQDYYRFNEEQFADPYTSGFNPAEKVQLPGALGIFGATLPADSLMRNFARQRIKGARFGSKRGSNLGVSELPSAHLIPDAYTSKFNEDTSNGKKLTSFTGKSVNGRTNLRLDQEEVASLERVLDAEYMPFYFQDLRTNEIIAFHAFLDDLSDSYTANYNSAGGYGRIEEIKTYKDTKRSVGCTFHVVATNEDDFDYMWWQINKLTTMVYPQWSEGKKLTAEVGNAKLNFTQPFSQIPTATPLIRVRVGDLIRSNYSRFNLKRVFGHKNTDSNLTAKNYFLFSGAYEKKGSTETHIVSTTYDLGTTAPKLNDETDKYEILYFGKGELLPVTLLVDKSDYSSFVGSADIPAAEIFYDPAENSVIRSFESTMGMGLAAVVTQLQFTWMDGLWGAGEDGPGYRAPRSCKVQMSFEPIHDIAPGLDHEGLNRAPIYPVGGLVNALVEGGITNPYGVGSESYLNGFEKKN